MSPFLKLELQAFFAEVVADVQNRIRTKPITKHGPAEASGRLRRSVHSLIDHLGGEVRALSYIDNLTKGTPPGKFVPIATIANWIVDKGLDKKLSPFTVRNTIFREGTTVFKQGGSDLLDNLINGEKRERLKKLTIDTTIAEYRAQVLPEFQKIGQ